MSICPKGKKSKSKRDMRRAHTWKISMASLATCPKCGETIRAHRACRNCGTYNKRQVIAVD